MGRPRLVIDKRLLELKAQGLSYRQIAQRLNLSHMTVYRAVTKLCNKTVTKPVTKPPSTNLGAITTVLTPPSASLDLGLGHHLLWTGEYQGKQPVSLESYRYGTNGCNSASVFHRGAITIRIHAHRFEIYCNETIGDTSGEIKARAYGAGRAFLRDIAQEHNLAIDYAHIERRWELHITFGEEHQKADKLVLEAIRQSPDRAMDELGMLAGDRSHPDQTEFIGNKGGMSFDALSFAIKQLPVLASHIGEYNENIKMHMEVQKEQLKTLKEIQKSLKGN